VGGGKAPVEGRWVDRINELDFAVDDIEDVVTRLRAHGAEFVGEVAQYEDSYRLCYVRGPAGIVVAWPSSCAERARDRS
jgi:hypothetical protein